MKSGKSFLKFVRVNASRLLVVAISLFSFIRCTEEEQATRPNAIMKPAKPRLEFRQLESETPSTDPQRKATVVVKNTADYSEAFIAGLRESTGFRKFNLEDSLLIVDNQDTILFPQRVKLDDEIQFTGRKGELAIALRVKRINYSTVSYVLEMVEFGKSHHNQKGTADLSSGFFLGSESDEANGELYMVDEFIDQREGYCLLKIRIGNAPGNSNSLVCKVVKNCNGKLKNITLTNFPALQEK